MLSKLRFSVAVAACAAMPVFGSAAVAATDNGNFASRGLGAQSCADVISMLESEEGDLASLQFAAWVGGYISHANRTTEGIFDVMPIQDVYAVATIVARLCEQNPDSPVEPAMASLVSMLSPGAQSEPSEISTVEHEGASTAISQNTMQRVQVRLAELGHLPEGGADGVYGPQTRQALEAFQSENSINQNGIPDPITLFVIFADM